MGIYSKMKISLAMTTYNGEKYVAEQLQSMVEQKQPPDEIVICDDCSSDSTYAIISSFVERYQSDIAWVLVRNEKNLGFVENFKKTVSLTTGDLVFIADQDDIWLPDKISLMAGIMEKNQTIEYLETHRKYFKDDLQFMNNKDRLFAENGKLVKIGVEQAINYPLGCSMKLAVRGDFLRNYYNRILNTRIWIDHGLCALAAARGTAYFYNVVTAYYRVHFSNVSSPGRSLKDRFENIPSRIEARKKDSLEMRDYAVLLDGFVSEKILSELNKAEMFMLSKADCLRNRKLMPLIQGLFSGNTLINKRVILADLLCVIFGKY